MYKFSPRFAHFAAVGSHYKSQKSMCCTKILAPYISLYTRTCTLRNICYMQALSSHDHHDQFNTTAWRNSSAEGRQVNESVLPASNLDLPNGNGALQVQDVSLVLRLAESVVPNLLHVFPIQHDVVLNGVAVYQTTMAPIAISTSSQQGVTDLTEDESSWRAARGNGSGPESPRWCGESASHERSTLSAATKQPCNQ